MHSDHVFVFPLHLRLQIPSSLLLSDHHHHHHHHLQSFRCRAQLLSNRNGMNAHWLWMMNDCRNYDMDIEEICPALMPCARISFTEIQTGREPSPLAGIIDCIGYVGMFYSFYSSLPSARRWPSWLLAVKRGVLYGTPLDFVPKRNAPF